jgi:hypothetical protein
MAHRCFSGGVNQVVIHGQSYSGDYANTTWPGHVPFRYYASDLWNTKRPDWDHGLGQALEYLGRIQHVQRQGLARVDVAVYHKKSITDPDFNTIYQAEDLISNGTHDQERTPLLRLVPADAPPRLVVQLSDGRKPRARTGRRRKRDSRPQWPELRCPRPPLVV